MVFQLIFLLANSEYHRFFKAKLFRHGSATVGTGEAGQAFLG